MTDSNSAAVSKPLAVLIVDDEDLARSKLRRLLKGAAPDAIVLEAANGFDALSAIKAKAPDVVFLDIEMPGLGGFDVLDHLETRPFALIFQTALDAFAVKAFEANACDYLLKPYNEGRFQQAFERAVRMRQSEAALTGLGRALRDDRRYLDRFCVTDRGVRIVVAITDVEALVSRDHYTCLHAGDKEYLLDLSLAHLEERLDPSLFVRIHRSALARVGAIRAMTKGDEPQVELTSGLTLPVSRRCRGGVIARLAGR